MDMLMRNVEELVADSSGRTDLCKWAVFILFDC